jgi:hypothetical protein
VRNRTAHKMSWLHSIFGPPSMVSSDLPPAEAAIENGPTVTSSSGLPGLPRNEPSEDFADHYYEYTRIEPDVYGVRREGSRRVHYLVTEEHRAYKWCVRLARAVRSEAASERRRKPVDAMDEQPTSVPGIVGAFVSVGMGEPPVFAFEQPSGTFILRDTANAVVRNPLHMALLEKQTPIDRDYIHLHPFTLTGDTGPFIPPIERNGKLNSGGTNDAKRAAAVAADAPTMVYIDLNGELATSASTGTTSTSTSSEVHERKKFTRISPVDPNDTSVRWFVIANTYWVLFKAFEATHFVSGCYLMTRVRNEEVRALDAAGARELELFSSQHQQWLAIEHLMRRLGDPSATEKERLLLIDQGREALARLDALRHSQAEPTPGD